MYYDTSHIITLTPHNTTITCTFTISFVLTAVAITYTNNIINYSTQLSFFLDQAFCIISQRMERARVTNRIQSRNR